MRQEILEYIYSKEDVKRFIREQPYWYRKLSRDPTQLEKCEIASLNYFQKTIPHRVEKFANGLQMASVMMNMFQSMNAQQ